VALLAALGAGAWVLAAALDGGERGPIAVPNTAAREARETVIDGVRHVVSPDAPERLLPDTTFPSEPVHLLFLEGRATQPTADGGALATDGAGGVVHFAPSLAQRRPIRDAGHVELVSAAADRHHTWLADAEGGVWRQAADGTLDSVGPVSLDYPALAADPHGDGVWLVRRPQRWEYRLQDGDAPLLERIDSRGATIATVGRVVVPHAMLLAELASAGSIAVSGDTVYFAPFIRDEVVAFAPSGDTLWVASRDLPQSTPAPDLAVEDGVPVIDYHPVNLGLAVGPNGRLYVLSTPGFTTEESRLDVFDRATGRLRRSARFMTPLPTVAVAETGRLHLLDGFALLTGIDPAEREAFAAFDLEVLGRGRMRSADLHGGVTLVNFWASWCEPCRAEMPALDSLARSIDDERFRFVTMNEDANAAAAEAFVKQFAFDFPVLLGRARLRERYHYVGLPFTVLLDRDGRVAQRWVGFAGPRQIQAVRAAVRRELARNPEPGREGHHRH
jgi:thiol-disulfide isomerase/thioredoxin